MGYVDRLEISTAIERPDEDGGMVEYDVTVTFKATYTGRAYQATYTDPAAWPDVDVEFVSAALDDADEEPLTDEETAKLRAWLYGDGMEMAAELALEKWEPPGRDPDAERDRRMDDLLEGL